MHHSGPRWRTRPSELGHLSLILWQLTKIRVANCTTRTDTRSQCNPTHDTVIIEPPPSPDNNGRSRACRCGWHDGGLRQLPEATTLGHFHSLRAALTAENRADGFVHLAGPDAGCVLATAGGPARRTG